MLAVVFTSNAPSLPLKTSSFSHLEKGGHKGDIQGKGGTKLDTVRRQCVVEGN